MTTAPKPRNRSSFLFVAGLVLAAGTAALLDSSWRLFIGEDATAVDLAQPITLRMQTPHALSAADMAAATVAWSYFENNTNPATGFVGAVQDFPSTTMWDQGSYILALVSASRLGLIDKVAFLSRADKLIASLGNLPLYDGRIPNKSYDIRTLEMTDYENNPVPIGIGWSAIDTARFLLAVRVLENYSPAHSKPLRTAMEAWDVCAIASAGELVGSARERETTVLRQEGRIGYEQYAGRAAALWGCDSLTAATAERIVVWQSVSGIEVPADRRGISSFGSISPTLSEPYMLAGLELGFNRETELLAAQVYAVNEARYLSTGIPTAVSEDHIDRAPYFLYASVLNDGVAWAVTDDKGNSFPEMRAISLKAVMAWDALYATSYTADLRSMLEDLAVEGEGWQAGKYEIGMMPNTALTLNTNAVVLEAMHYKAFGSMLTVR